MAPFETVHGAYSEPQVRPRAAAHRRRLLRRLHLRPRDLDPIAKAHLDLYVRSIAMLDILDGYFAAGALLDGKGVPAPAARLYLAAHANAQRSLSRLEKRLRERGVEAANIVTEMQAVGRRPAA